MKEDIGRKGVSILKENGRKKLIALTINVNFYLSTDGHMPLKRFRPSIARWPDHKGDIKQQRKEDFFLKSHLKF